MRMGYGLILTGGVVPEVPLHQIWELIGDIFI